MSLKGKAAATTLRGRINALYKIRGYSAYEVAVICGFKGTEEEWLASLKGPVGDSGVYVGSGVMPEGYNIHIDPDGEYVFGGPKIENGTWWLWDEDTGDYVDTGVPATGPKGDPGGAVLTEADKADLVAQTIAALPNGDDTEYPEGGGTFTFTVDGTSYEAEEGMTWRQFIESEYNVKKECDCGCGEMYSTFDIQWGVDEGVGIDWECSPGSSVYYEESSEGYVRPDDVIENGRSYLVFEGYPGDYGNSEPGYYCDNCNAGPFPDGEYAEADRCPNCGDGMLWYRD